MVMNNGERFKAEMIERHRPAFELWQRCHEMLERAVVLERDLSEPFARSLDLLWVQAFKSHGSLYLLCVAGQGEDAATIARRLLEILLQVAYLCVDEDERTERGKRFLAYFWLQADRRVKSGLSENEKKWWENAYRRHKKYLIGRKGRPIRNWWGDGSLRDIARATTLEHVYTRDYSFLSQMAHCTSQGIMMERVGGKTEIRTTGILIPLILTYGTAYMLLATEMWNKHFGLIELELPSRLLREVADLIGVSRQEKSK